MPIIGQQGSIYFARHRIEGTKSHVGKLSTYIVKIGQSFFVLLKAAS